MKSNRRDLLRGAAGLGLLPLLPSLAPREARGATPPVRRKFVALWTPNGQRQEQWTPFQPASRVYPGNVREGALDQFKDTGISPVLGPAFAPFLPRMTFLKGLDFPRSMGHNHTGMLGGFGPEPTLDQVLGRSSKFYGGETPGMGSLLLSAGYGGSFSADVIGGRYTTLPAYDNLDAAYARAFFAAAPGERQRHRRIIDRVVEQYTRLRANPRLSRADGQALDAHVTLMAQLEDRLTKQRALTCDAVPPGPVRGAANTDNALDLTVAALSCGVTQVVCINLYYAPMATPNDWHGDSHTPEAGGKTVQRLLDINRWVAENAFLKLLRKMDAVVEPNGGTLLDNSIVMWGNELSAGNGHTNDDQPVVLAGSAGGWLRTGVMLDYTQYDRPPVPADNAGSTRRVGRLYNQLLSTIMLAMGLDRSDFEKPGRPGFGDPLSQSLDRNARYDATRAEAGDPLPRINAKP